MENTHERHVSPLGYIGYGILFAIPVIGWIFILVFSFKNNYICRRNYARYHLIGLVLGLILVAVLYFTGFDFAGWYDKYIELFRQV